MPLLDANQFTLPIKQESLSDCQDENWPPRGLSPMDMDPDDEDACDSGDSSGLDDSLTSLNWLQNLQIMKLQPTPPNGGGSAKSGGPANRFGPKPGHPRGYYGRGVQVDIDYDNIDYKTNPYVKPPYSYATLICMAMKASNRLKMTLSSIYEWIVENFRYYQTAEPSWQNSIRHNLSLNKCFTKVPREKNEPGKGGFWKINPEYAEILLSGAKKRRTTPQIYHANKRQKCHDSSNNNNNSSNNYNKKLNKKSQKGSSHHLPNLDGSYQMNPNDPKVVVMPTLNIPEEEAAITALKADVSWGSLMDNEICVDGVKCRTEEILNENDPYSIENSIDEMLLSFEYRHSHEVVETGVEDDTVTTTEPNLIVRGHHITPTALRRNDTMSRNIWHKALNTPEKQGGRNIEELEGQTLTWSFSGGVEGIQAHEYQESFDMGLFDFDSIPEPLA